MPNGYVAVADGRIAEVGHGHGLPPHAKAIISALRSSCRKPSTRRCIRFLAQRDQRGLRLVHARGGCGRRPGRTIVDMPYDEGDLICSAAAVERKVVHAGKAGAG